MADRTETLLFIVDVDVRNAKALRELRGDLAAAAENDARRLLALKDTANGTADAHRDLAAAIERVNGAATNGGNGATIIQGNGDRPIVPVRANGEGVGAGTRSREWYGSRTNPMAVAVESPQAGGLGGLAAPASSADQPSPVAPPPVTPPGGGEKSWLQAAAEQVAAKVMQPEDDRVLAAIGAASRLRSAAPEGGTLAAVDAVRAATMDPGVAAALASLPRHTGATGPPDTAGVLAAAEMVRATSAAPGRGSLAQTLATVLSTRQAAGGAPVLLSAAAAAGRLGVSRSKVYELAGAGALAGAAKSPSGEWQIPESSVAALAAGGIGGVLGGGGAGGGGGGGGGAAAAAAAGGGAGGGLLAKLLWGGGSWFGLAGLGSVAGLAGLGPEHLLMTALGLGGSAVGALGGAGLLGLGAAGVAGVGGGSDAAVISSTVGDTKALSQAITAVSQAQAVYGKNSTQAAQATAQLNYQMAALGNTAGVKAEIGLAKAGQALDHYFDLQTSSARVQAVKLLMQGVQTGYTFVPLVAQAATTNLTVINRDLKPLFDWIRGPQGIGIFNDLENEFAHNLPSALAAGSQALELFLRVTDLASRYTGGFTQRLDSLFTRLNGMSNAQLNQEIGKLIGDFETWRMFVDALIRDIARLFSNDVGTGQGIIQTLTVMLDKLGQWENSVQGRQSLMTIFTVHKAEVEQLLRVIPLLIRAFAPIELTLGPGLTKAFNLVAKSILDVVNAIEKIPGGTWLVGIGLLTAKIGVLGTLLGKAATAFGILNKATAANAALSAAAGGAGAVGGAERAAGGAVAGAEGGAAAAGGAGLFARFLSGGLAGKLASSPIGTATESGILRLAGTAAATGGQEGVLAASGLAGAADTAGMAGLADAISTAGLAVAPIAAALTPLLVGVGGVVGLVELFNLFSSSTPPQTKYNATQLGRLLQQHGVKALALPADTVPGVTAPATGIPHIAASNPYGRSLLAAMQSPPGTPHPTTSVGQSLLASQGTAAGAGPTIADIGATKAMKQALQDWINTVSNAGVVSKMTASEIAGMIHAGQGFAKISPPNAQLINKYISKLKTDLAPMQSVMATMSGRWKSDLADSLKGAVDVADTNTHLIAYKIDLNSNEGRQLMAKNLAAMLADVQSLMDKSKVSVSAGLAAIDKLLKKGVSQGAISWKTQWQDMFTTLTELFAKHKIDARTYTTDLQGLMHDAAVHIKQDTVTQEQQRQAQLKTLYDHGVDTEAQTDRKMHGERIAANAQAQADMQAFAGVVAAGWIEAAAAAGKGGNVILAELNAMLKKLGVAGVGQISVSAGQIADAAKNPDTPLHGMYSGGKVTRPSYMVGEEAPAHPEYVLATNPAYRQRNIGLWAEAGHHLGVHGFAKGGVHGGSLARMISEANLINSKHYPYVWGGGHNGSFSGPYDCSGAVSAVLHAGGYLGMPEVSGQLASFGLPGPGAVTIYANPTHTFMSLMGRFFGTHGSSGAGWYAGSALPGFAVRHPAVAGSLGTILAPHISGHTALAAADRAGLAKVARAANAKLNAALAATMSAGQVGGGDWGTFPTGRRVAPAAWLAVATKLASQHGWGPAQLRAWEGVENIEDPAYSLTAKNPTSLAYGLAQGITGPGWYAAHGGNASTLTGQLTAMANYIASVYGTPSGALAHEHSSGFYRKGGKVDWAGKFGNGGTVTATRPTLAMFGDNGAETATFIPAHKTAALYGRPVGQPQVVTPGELYGTPVGKPIVVDAQTVKDLTKAVEQLTSGITKMTTLQGTQSSLASTLQGLHAGTTLKSLGLTGPALKATGLTKAQAQALIGGGPASDAALAALDQSQAATDKSEQAKLTRLYDQAVKTHNKKLATSLLGQLTAVDSALASAISGDQAALVQQITDTANQFADSATAAGNTVSLLQAIQGLNPGSSLSALGLSPSILATLGLSSSTATSAAGTGLSYYQNLQSTQGGYLTPAQIAAATSGVNSLNASLTSQETPLEGELAYYQSQLPSLSGSDLTNAIATMSSVASQLVGLGTTIQGNNTALTALTAATTANTAATTSNTGAMTGTVSYTYQGQSYLASDTVVGLGVGG